LVFGIFDLKVADPQTNKQTHPQNSTLSDNKGRLKLSAREPIRTRKTYSRAEQSDKLCSTLCSCIL